MAASNNLICYIAGVFPSTACPFIGQFIATWHLTMKLFSANCHEWATLRKLWRQTGNSSLLPAKCWPLLPPLGNSEFCFPRISMFHSTSSPETLRSSGNKIHCSPFVRLSPTHWLWKVQLLKKTKNLLGTTVASYIEVLKGFSCNLSFSKKERLCDQPYEKKNELGKIHCDYDK